MNTKIIRTCVDLALAPELVVEAAQRAIAENPANAPAVQFTPGIGAFPPPPSFMAVLTGRRWRSGRTLRVRFLGGDPEVQRRLQPFAHQWSDFANIKFVFGDDLDAEIRIAFADDGSWSCVGTDALTVPANQPTMNYGWLTPGTEDGEYSRVVIHEFGHALGCIHEHQSPAAEIPWDKEAVYRYYQGPPNNWSRADVDLNLFQRYGQTITQFTEFDPHSIMLYAIPNDFTIGDFEVGWNTVLSPRDKEFIATIYPKVQPGATELVVGAQPIAASIGRHDEEDLYKFVAGTAGAYVIETQGWTNVILRLCGPDDPAKVIAEDDNGGFLWNARIAAQLAPGAYYATVRHRRPTGLGNYSISVRIMA